MRLRGSNSDLPVCEVYCWLFDQIPLHNYNRWAEVLVLSAPVVDMYPRYSDVFQLNYCVGAGGLGLGATHADSRKGDPSRSGREGPPGPGADRLR